MIRQKHILLEFIILFSFIKVIFGNQEHTNDFCAEADFYTNNSSGKSDNDSFASSEIAYEFYIAKLNRNSPIDLEYNPDVKDYIESFLKKRRGELETSLGRSGYYFPIIEELLDKYDLPLELKYLAVIESGLNPFARSKSGAVGLWQFLYNTCSLFDLRVDSYIDERRDPYKSTEAACKYLQYLYDTFNDWNLVMASYNGGPGEVRKAIERSGGKTDYWDIRPFLSKQAANYIPAFVAMNYLMNYYSLHGVVPSDLTYNYRNTDTLNIRYSVTFSQIAEVLDIPVNLIAQLNPVYKTEIIPETDKPCSLVLPLDKMEAYLKFEYKILSKDATRNDYIVLVENSGNKDNRKKIMHTVEKGEYFHKIALKYNCTIENIKAWNNIEDNTLYPGQVLEIWIAIE